MHKLTRAITSGWSNLIVWCNRSFITAIAIALVAASAYAEEVIWIGRPTTGDYMAQSMNRAIEQFAELRQEMTKFEADIEQARRAYFAASASDRSASGEKFGELLFQKDLLIAWPQVASDGDPGKAMSNLIALASKSNSPDGGIPPSAREAFTKWLNALRFRVGGGLGMTPDPIATAAALQNSANLEEYEVYRRLRDQAEWDEWEAHRNGGNRRLLASHVVNPGTYFGQSSKQKGFDHFVAQIENKVLQCEYAGRQVDGLIFHFWEGQPPENIAFLIAMNPQGFNRLVDHAVSECPPDSKKAMAIASSPVSVAVTPRIAAEASIKALYLPGVLSPAQEEQMIRAQLQKFERQTERMERGAKLLACEQELIQGVNAAKQSEDQKNGIKETQAKYQKCKAALRSAG